MRQALVVVQSRSPGPPVPSTSGPARHLGAGIRLVRTLLHQREAALVGFIVVIGIVMTVLSSTFLTAGNLEAVGLGLSSDGVIAIGMTYLLASGRFDLSVGSILAFGGVIAGLFDVHGVPAPLAILLGVIICGGIGLVNGLLVTKGGINCFIETLGMLTILQGVVLLVGGGFGISNMSSSFDVLGQGQLGSVQYPIIIALVLAGIGDVLMRKSRAARYAYYVGGNEKAARLTGIRVDRVVIIGFVLTGVLAGFAGIVEAARFGSASVSVGASTPLNVIAEVVIGGAALAGGSGTVLGSLLGALLLQLILNALNLLGVATYWQPVASGLVLIAAVGFDTLTGRLDLRGLVHRRQRPSAGAEGA